MTLTINNTVGRVDSARRLDEPYRYVEKKWNGQIVAKVRDLYEIWKPLSRYAIRYNIKKHLNLGTDYFHLTGKALAQFKEDCNNDPSVKLANELFIITFLVVKLYTFTSSRQGGPFGLRLFVHCGVCRPYIAFFSVFRSRYPLRGIFTYLKYKYPNSLLSRSTSLYPFGALGGLSTL